MKLLILALVLFCGSVEAAPLSAQSYWEGFKTSFLYLYQGSYEQFREKNNLYYAGAAVPALWYSFEEDKRISSHARTKSIPKAMQISSDLAPVLSFPVISAVTFTIGTKNDDPKMVRFAEEYFASMYLALVESAALSLIDVHERPSKEHLAKVETAFRGKSSFPSGHVIPYATLAFKTFQFYGPVMATIPTALFVMTSMQRVRDGKHYLSDVVGGFFLSAWASEGVRKASAFDQNHPIYRKIFEHDLAFGLIEHEGSFGPRLSFSF